MKNTKTNTTKIKTPESHKETGEASQHIPVLLSDVLHYLNPQKAESYLDVTAGYGGHASKILERTLSPKRTVLVDRDQHAIDYLQQQFKATGVEIIHKDYFSASNELLVAGSKFDIILADIGVSSLHLDSANRGFSLRADGPLDMRMDERQSITAGTIVNNYEPVELVNLLFRYGEEPRAKKIVRLIMERRPITTTHELAAICAQAWPGHSKIHPATRTFQALRIAVNDELAQLERALPVWMDLLAPGGRIAIISFHSLEDRLVKSFFNQVAGDRYDATLRLLTKHPVTGSQEEIVFNPRARSAKLRAAVKIKISK
ncbi:MAG: 16S rRNA (cytosine(1402)-N(4))-methyltransferase RsmH [Candidatus Saccharimonadales bacterium]